MLVIVTSQLPYAWRAAALGPIVLIHPKWRGCDQTMAHEKQHVRQWCLITALCLPVLTALLGLAGWPLAALAYTIVGMSSRVAVAFFEADAHAAEVRHGLPLAEAALDFLFCYESGWSKRRARSVIRSLARNPWSKT
jgi:uncharacterized membrane protein YuzA (DUF378 family)